MKVLLNAIVCGIIGVNVQIFYKGEPPLVGVHTLVTLANYRRISLVATSDQCCTRWMAVAF